LILASASPRRRDLLEQLGLPFVVQVAGVDETALNGEAPRAHTTRLARAKAAEIAARFPDDWVLGADTAVIVDEHILGKPANTEDAVRMLRLISGRWHTVLTGYCLLHRTAGTEFLDCCASEVFIRPLTEDQMRAYVATGEPLDKAGSYAIQGIGAGLVQQVRGSYTNVVGLPLAEVAVLWERIHGEGVLIGGAS